MRFAVDDAGQDVQAAGVDLFLRGRQELFLTERGDFAVLDARPPSGSFRRRGPVFRF